MARLVQQVEALSEVTSTSTTATTIASLTAALTNGKTYALFWSFQATSSTTSILSRARLMDSTGGVELSRYRVLPSDTTDYVWQGGVACYTAAATANRTFVIDFNNASGTGTTYIKTARLVILELDSLDKFAGDTSFVTTTNTSYTSALDLTFTPATSGDYLFFACGTAAFAPMGIKLLTPGGTSVNEAANILQITTPYGGWAAMWRETLAASSQTASIQYKSAVGESEQVGFRYIIALRVDRLQNVQTTQDDTADGGTSATYVDSETLSATGLAANVRDTIIIAAATVGDSSTTESSYVDVREGSTTLMESIHEGASATANQRSGMLAYKVADSSSSITYKVRRKSETTATTTTVQYASIFIFETPPNLSGVSALTESDDSASATGTLAIKGASASTESDDSVSAVGQHVTSAAAALTEADDGVSATATLAITGAASITEADDATTATGNLPIVGQNALTESDDSVTAEGALLIQGASALTETNDSVSAAGSLYIAGLADLIESDDSVDANDFVPRGHADLIEDEDFIATTGRVPLEWLDALATRHDVPNRTLCAVCARPVLPETMHRQVRRVGQRLVWTGLYACQTCIDIPGDPPPIHRHADPRPVPNARPSRS